MPIVFWSVVLGGAAAATVVLNRRTRTKCAALAAPLTQTSVVDPSLASRSSDNLVGLAAEIQYTKPPTV